MSEHKIAQKLQWSRTGLRRLIEKLVDMVKFTRSKSGPKAVRLCVTPLTGYKGARSKSGPKAVQPHYREKENKREVVKERIKTQSELDTEVMELKSKREWNSGT